MNITNKPVETIIQFQKKLLQYHAWQSCINCSEWQAGDSNLPTGCKRFQAMPPPDVIVNGCEWHLFDIPF